MKPKINTKLLAERLASKLEAPPSDEYAGSIWDAFQSLIPHIYCLIKLGHKHKNVLKLLKAEESSMSQMTDQTFSRYYQRAIKDPLILRRCKIAFSELMADKKRTGGKTTAVTVATAPLIPAPISESPPAPRAVVAVVPTPAAIAPPPPAAVAVGGGDSQLTAWYPIANPLPPGKFRPVPIDEEDRANPALQLKRPQFDPKNPPAGFWDDDKLFEHPAIPGLLLDRIERRFSRCMSYHKDSSTYYENGKQLYQRKFWNQTQLNNRIPDGSTPFILDRTKGLNNKKESS